MMDLLIIKGVTSNGKSNLNFDYVPCGDTEMHKTHISKSRCFNVSYNGIQIRAYANSRALTICDNDTKKLKQEVLKYLHSLARK